VLSREELIQSVIGEGVSVSQRTIDTHVYTLRKKLGPCNTIDTVRGFGYVVNLGNRS
jgi:two-component system phosphate regulon response regulator PhoB